MVTEGLYLNGGVLVATSSVHYDTRGSFTEVFRSGRHHTHNDGFAVCQVSIAINHRGALRGLHFTDIPPGQSKQITCIGGRLFDVIVDVRVGSPTFANHVALELSANDGVTVYMTPGMAHGYLALENNTSILYLHDATYAPEYDRDLQALDPDLAIVWPNLPYLRSLKDAAAPSLAESLRCDVLPSFTSY